MTDPNAPPLDDALAAADYERADDRVLTDRERAGARRVRRSDGYDVPVTVRLSRTQVAALRSMARQNDTTVTKILRAAVDDSIAEPPDADVVSVMEHLEESVKTARRAVEAAARLGQAERRSTAG